MISYAKALEIISALKFQLPKEKISLESSLGRMLATELSATIPSPPFSNSAMDGFAVNAATVRLSSPHRVVSTIFAQRTIMTASADPAVVGPEADECVRIMTGAPMPLWADAVIPVEKTRVDSEKFIVFLDGAKKGDHVRLIGEDWAKGEVVLTERTLMTAEKIMVAAAFGHSHVETYAQPVVLIVSTGDELKEPGATLQPGEIFNSSKYFLQAATTTAGLRDVTSISIADAPIEACQILSEKIAEADAAGRPMLILTTGAVSAGEKDFIPTLASDLGFECLFHKVAIRPGKPVFAGKKGRHVWLGLPGNPISTATTWHYFGRPLLSACAGLPAPRKERAVLAEDVSKPAGLTTFYRARYLEGTATSEKNQGSSHFRASSAANCYIELPEGGTKILKGAVVEALLI